MVQTRGSAGEGSGSAGASPISLLTRWARPWGGGPGSPGEPLDRARALLPPVAGVQGVAQAVPDEVDGEYAQGDGDAGDDEGVVAVDEDPVAATEGVGEHRAPPGGRGAGAEAQQGEVGHVRDGRSEGEGGLHDQGRQAVGENAGEDDLGVARP